MESRAGGELFFCLLKPLFLSSRLAQERWSFREGSLVDKDGWWCVECARKSAALWIWIIIIENSLCSWFNIIFRHPNIPSPYPLSIIIAPSQTPFSLSLARADGRGPARPHVCHDHHPLKEWWSGLRWCRDIKRTGRWCPFAAPCPQRPCWA